MGCATPPERPDTSRWHLAWLVGHSAISHQIHMLTMLSGAALSYPHPLSFAWNAIEGDATANHEYHHDPTLCEYPDSSSSWRKARQVAISIAILIATLECDGCMEKHQRNLRGLAAVAAIWASLDTWAVAWCRLSLGGRMKVGIPFRFWAYHAEVRPPLSKTWTRPSGMRAHYATLSSATVS